MPMAMECGVGSSAIVDAFYLFVRRRATSLARGIDVSDQQSQSKST